MAEVEPRSVIQPPPTSSSPRRTNALIQCRKAESTTRHEIAAGTALPAPESRSLKPIAGGVALSLVMSLWVGGAGAANAARWVMTDLTPGASYASAHLINNRGQVVGGAGERLFVWENGKLTYLSVPSESASARAMNDRGQIVGWTSNESGVQGAAVCAADCLSSRALAINDRGQAVGICERTKGRRHAVLWTLRRD